MSQFRHRTFRAIAPQARSRSRARFVVWLGSAGAAMIVIVAFIAAGASVGGDNPERTGEVNAMGMPVIDTPGSGSGTTNAAGVAVTNAEWALGRVPLNVAVRPTWTLRNTSDQPVTLGEPHPEVRAGCCPGPALLGTRTLAPGASTDVTFELSMHPGMDGPHDLALHIPVDNGTGNAEVLTVEVTGDFRD